MANNEYDPRNPKHQIMRDLLVELGVPEPERSSFYSDGSTVTKPAINAALKAVQKYKAKVQNAAQTIIDL